MAHTADAGMAAWFAELSADMVEDFDEAPTVQRVCDGVLGVLPGCEGASVTVRRSRGRFETLAASSAEVRAWDELQYSLGEGPCLEAAADNDVIRSHDLWLDRRWPLWGPEVAVRGARSLISVRLSSLPAVHAQPPPEGGRRRSDVGADESEHAWGAMNIYSRRPGGFDDDQFDLATIYVTHAATALRAARQVTGLQTALESRHTIGIAQGIVMTQYGLSKERAFQLLKRYSSDSNRKLRDVANELVSTGKLPELPARTRAER